ncbi:MAG: hypothetical protein RIS76_1598, partial [Verrucomicrobiota bacterium]
ESDTATPYAFRLLNVDAAPRLTWDLPVSTNIPPRETRIYRFAGAVGQRVDARSQPEESAVNGHWTIYDPYNSAVGTWYWYGDFYSYWPSQQLRFGLSSSRDYTLVVNSYETTNRVFSATLRLGNHAPVIGAVPNATINELASYSATVTASDPEAPNDQIRFSLGGVVPAGAAIGAASGQFTWTPTEAQGPGVYPITVVVTDDGIPPLSSSQVFNITVLEANLPPVWGALADQLVDEGGTLSINLPTLPATDPDLPAQTLSRSLVSGPAGLTVSAAGVLAWAPGETFGGTTNLVTVAVTDNGSPALSATNSFRIVVREVNQAPLFPAVPDQIGSAVSAFTMTLVATDADVPLQTLTFSLVSGSSAVSVLPSGVLSMLGNSSLAGTTNIVVVKVADNGVPSLSVTNTFRIRVPLGNQPPVLPLIADQTVNELVALNLTVAATDADLPAQTLTRTLVSGPAGLILTPAGALTWTPGETFGGTTNLVIVKVTDSGVPTLSATNSFRIIVREVNQPPLFPPVPDQIGSITTGFSLTLPVTDPDLPAQILTYAILSGPPGVTITPTGVLSLTPTAALAGTTNVVTVRVTDNGVPPLSVTNSFRIIFPPANRPPVLPLIADQTVDELVAVNLTVAATDPDLPAQTLSHMLVGGPAGLTLTVAGALNWTPSETQGGTTNLVTVKVIDNGVPALSATNSFRIIVREVNRVPVLPVIVDQTAPALAPYALTLGTTDPDLPAQTLTHGLVSGPAGLTVSGPGVIAWTPTVAQVGTTNLVTVKVTDNGVPALSATNSFRVIVRPGNQLPVLPLIADQTVNELVALNLTVPATDSDLPAQVLTRALVSGPVGLTVSPAGALAWTPDETFGGTTNLVTVKVTDSG